MASFKRPLSEISGSEDPETGLRPGQKPNIYDAVAGRVTVRGYIKPGSSKQKDKTAQPLRPDEVLYKAPRAPPRYEESDHYFAHTSLPSDQKLPSSELLSALHGWFSNYYDRSQASANQKVWKFMDETALIALGILMEESAREILGETGDLALTEAMDESEDSEEDRAAVSGDEKSITQKSEKGKLKMESEASAASDFESDSVWSASASQDGSDES